MSTKETKQYLREKIKDLERDARYRVLTTELQVKEAKFKALEDLRTEHYKFSKEYEGLKVQVKEMEKRWDTSIQKQQSDLIKALVVKLPTLEIKELHAHSKGK